MDLGAYTGDSAQSFIDSFGRWRRIYCYEITASSMRQMQENLKDYDNIVYRQASAESAPPCTSPAPTERIPRTA